MQTHSLYLIPLMLAGVSLTSIASAQGTRFAEPVQVSAGSKLLGKGRLYPSPATYDINGDGRHDVFIGDLIGHITYALRQADGTFGDEQKLKDAKGKVLDFGNW